VFHLHSPKGVTNFVQLKMLNIHLIINRTSLRAAVLATGKYP